MTRLEKALELHPDLSEEKIMYHYCPEELLRCDTVSCPITYEFCCDVCWNRQYEEVEQNTMPKAILELEMPTDCLNCPCSQHMGLLEYKCGVNNRNCPDEGRRLDCPLKEAE